MTDDQVNRAVGRALRAMRRAKGFSQDEVAGIMGTRQHTVSRYENGTRTPDLAVVYRYSAAIGVRPFDVLQLAHAEAQAAVPDDLVTRAKAVAEKINRKGSV